jgi:DNA helicase-2/ATP-dependent DNA helicase PcrA
VVGDEDQTIYTFTGATSTFLTTFAERHAGARVVTLTENYRSTPEILELANRLIASAGRSKRLTATRESGPRPTIVRHLTAEAELDAIVARIGELLRGGVLASEIAILVRMNAQLAPIEAALTRAGLDYRVRGIGFYRRPDVRAAIDLIRRVGTGGEAGVAVAAGIRAIWARELGHEEGVARTGDEARERAAALDTLLGIVDDIVAADPTTDRDAVHVELGRRAASERSAAESGVGIELATYHRAKGLEWDAVFLPILEEGSLPIRQALDDDGALEEERRLLYVGITRARIHLALSWAEQRESRGREARRRPSRFLDGLVPRPAGLVPRPAGPTRRVGEADVGGVRGASAARRVVELGHAFAPTPAPRDGESPLLTALRGWRSRRARADEVPAFVVAHDTTLAAIAEMRPASLAALRRVKGMGPAKLERYGAEILEVIAASS